LIVCDWPHFVWTKSVVCKDDVLQGIPLFKRVLEDSAVKKFGSLPAVRTIVPSRPNGHLSTVPSVRKTCHTVRTPDRPSIIRSDDVDFRPDPSLYREASVPACIRSDVSTARPDASQYSTKLQILSKFIYGKIDATVRTRFSLRQESQFKFNRSDSSLPSSGRACT
jgi:hypothetical protein